MKQKQLKSVYFVFFLVMLLLLPSVLIHAMGGKELQADLDDCNQKVESLESESSQLKSENSQLKSDKESLESTIDTLESEKADLQSKIAQLEIKIAQKDKEIENLIAEAPDLMIVTRTIEEKVQEKEAEIIELRIEKNELETSVREINQELAKLKSENRTIKTKNESLTKQVKNLTDENEELLTTLEVYEGIQRETIELIDVVLERINELLYEEIRDGKVRVFKGTLGIVLDVVSEHMFDVGSVEINPGGKTILSKIGILLSELDGYLIGVIGNADNKPIVTPALKKMYPTNWELSAARGASVVRYFIDVSNVRASRLVSMGLGELWPIDTNKTDEGRGNNRRIDIVLLPIDVIAAVVIGAEIK